MAVCYGLHQPGGQNLHLSDSPSIENREMGILSTLLKWNEVDPPSREEKLRNDRVCKFYQHNRNPFVDHPEYASLIWKRVTPTHQNWHFPAKKELIKWVQTPNKRRIKNKASCYLEEQFILTPKVVPANDGKSKKLPWRILDCGARPVLYQWLVTTTTIIGFLTFTCHQKNDNRGGPHGPSMFSESKTL